MENKCAICGKQGDLFTLEYEEDGEQCARKVCGSCWEVIAAIARRVVEQVARAM
jgi:recombinational DNA repair protein (RecF pathway)